MESLGQYIDMKAVRAMAKKNGVNVDDPELSQKVSDYRRNTHNEWVGAVHKSKADHYASLSLFDGGQRLKFTFSQWNPNLQKNKAKATEVARQAHALAESMVNKPAKVVMVGGPGVGKTSLALAMMQLLRNKGKSVMFVSSAELSTMYDMRYDYPDIKKRLESVLEAMKTVDVLVLDDAGTEAGVRADRAIRRDLLPQLEHVANARFDIQNNRTLRSTIVTTNNNIEELQNVYSPKMISRLLPHKSSNQIIFDQLEDMRE